MLAGVVANLTLMSISLSRLSEVTERWSLNIFVPLKRFKMISPIGLNREDFETSASLG
jgi:hypothetical protein